MATLTDFERPTSPIWCSDRSWAIVNWVRLRYEHRACKSFHGDKESDFEYFRMGLLCQSRATMILYTSKRSLLCDFSAVGLWFRDEIDSVRLNSSTAFLVVVRERICFRKKRKEKNLNPTKPFFLIKNIIIKFFFFCRDIIIIKLGPYLRSYDCKEKYQ